MVATTGTASPTPSETARAAAAAAVLDRLKQRPALTQAQSEALANLEATRKALKDGPKKAAAARIAEIRTKLMALKLAAGVAAATGDIKLARATIKEVKALLKDLAKALRDAGILSEPAAPQMPVDVTVGAPGSPRGDGTKPADGSETGATKAAAPSSPAEVADAREDAKGILKDLRKIVAKLRLALAAARLRGADPREIREAETELRDGEKQLESLSTSLGDKSDGREVDLRA